MLVTLRRILANPWSGCLSIFWLEKQPNYWLYSISGFFPCLPSLQSSISWWPPPFLLVKSPIFVGWLRHLVGHFYFTHSKYLKFLFLGGKSHLFRDRPRRTQAVAPAAHRASSRPGAAAAAGGVAEAGAVARGISPRLAGALVGGLSEISPQKG